MSTYHYYSESKKEWLPIAEMATPHLANTIKKLETGNLDSVCGMRYDEGADEPGENELDTRVMDLSTSITARELLVPMRVELERRQAEEA